jgi:hypothetical protein
LADFSGVVTSNSACKRSERRIIGVSATQTILSVDWTMGNDRKSGGLTEARKLELEVRFRSLDADVSRQRRIIKELEEDGHPSTGAKTVLRLLEQEQSAILDELGYNPRAN